MSVSVVYHLSVVNHQVKLTFATFSVLTLET